MKDIKENILEEFTHQQDEEVKQTPTYREILENKIKIVNYKIEIKTKVEIQMIRLEMKNELDTDSLLDLQKKGC